MLYLAKYQLRKALNIINNRYVILVNNVENTII